jgi:hypothetical protein
MNPMKLSILLAQRSALLRQARLANLAFAYEALAKFAARIARAQLRGAVLLKSAAPDQERYCATLTALEGSQAVLDEHFTDEDVMELADVVAFLRGNLAADDAFRLEEVAERLLAPLRAELERAGIAIDEPAEQPQQMA